jgi:predicted nucleic acid-binding protein
MGIFITSELTFTEVLVHPIRMQDMERIELYERLLSDFVETKPVSRDVLYLAAKLRAESPTQRTPDALHVATAILNGASIFITGDRGIKNLPH